MTLHILRMCRVVFIFGLPREKKEVGNSVLQNRSGYMVLWEHTIAGCFFLMDFSPQKGRQNSCFYAGIRCIYS